MGDEGLEQAPESIEKRGISDDGAQKAAQTLPENGQNPLPSDPDVDRLAAMLRAIPAENRAEFLRDLADRIEGKDE